MIHRFSNYAQRESLPVDPDVVTIKGGSLDGETFNLAMQLKRENSGGPVLISSVLFFVPEMETTGHYEQYNITEEYSDDRDNPRYMAVFSHSESVDSIIGEGECEDDDDDWDEEDDEDYDDDDDDDYEDEDEDDY